MKAVGALIVVSTVMLAFTRGAEIRVKQENAVIDALEQAIRQKIVGIPIALKNINRADTGNANDYMDQVLELVRQEIVNQGLDNVVLPDGELGFSMPFWPFGTVFGGVRLYNGFMKGMETIQRVGDATLTYEGTTAFFESDCGINNAAMGYSLSITFLDIGPKGSMAGEITYANFYFKSKIDILSGSVVVENFDIKKIGHISTDISGLGIFNWLAELIADLAINLVKGVIKELLEGPIKAIMNQVLQAIVNSLLPTAAPLYFM